MTNLLYVTNRDLSQTGGAKSHVTGFCNAFQCLGGAVRIISARGPEEVPQKKNRSNIALYWMYVLSLVKIRRQVIDQVSSGWPDIVYYRKGIVDPGIIQVMLRRNNAFVCMEINGTQKDGSNKIRRVVENASGLTERWKFSNADLIITVSNEIRKRILSEYTEISTNRVLSVNNGVDFNIFYPRSKAECKRQIGIDENDFNIVFAGKTAWWHGLGTAIEAARILRKQQNCRFHFHVIGDGPALATIRTTYNDKECGDYIHFTGMISQEQVSLHIGASDICIAPFTAARMNDFGPSPLKVYEYAACGRPIIASRVKPLPEIVAELGDYAHIHLVDPDNPEALAAAIGQFMRQKTIAKINTKGLENVVSWHVRVRSILDHIESLKATGVRQYHHASV